MKVAFTHMIERDWPWVSRAVGVKRKEDSRGIIAVDLKTKAPVAVCVMDSWSRTSVQVHFAIMRKMVLRHGFLEEIANYVFGTCGRELMIGLVPSDNEAALKLDRHIGFTETYRIKDAFAKDVDCVIMELRKDECRWYSEDGRQVRRA